MKKRLLDLIVCPDCGNRLTLEMLQEKDGEIISGTLICKLCSKEFPIVSSVPRFTENDSYVKSFSFEWNLHKRTQLDSCSKSAVSKQQFANRINFNLKELKDKLVLDAGCGTGRYAEAALEHEAEVVCVDLSYSVDVARENLRRFKNVHFVQADLFRMPFKKGLFDFIYSYGVIHHTSDAKRAFGVISNLLKKGGKLSLFVYAAYNKGIVYSSAFWRILTTRLPKPILYLLSFISVPLYFIYRIPIIGNIGKMVFVIPMHKDWRWRVLDTFDWYSPKYQSKHTHWEVFGWFKENSFSEIQIYPDEVTMSGTKN